MKLKETSTWCPMKMSGVVYHFLGGATNATNSLGNRAGRSGRTDGSTRQSTVNIAGIEGTIRPFQRDNGTIVVITGRSILVTETLVSLVINKNGWSGPVSGGRAKRKYNFNRIGGRVRYYRSIWKLANKSPIRIDSEDHVWAVDVPRIN